MFKKKIILLGGGGHCKSVIDVIEQENVFKIAGIIDNELPLNNSILNYNIIGTDDDLKKLRKKYKYAFITVGQIQSSRVRVRLFEKLKKLNFILPTIVSPFAYISKYTTINEGSIIMHHALINAGVTIGKNTIINSKALIEHESIIGDHCHISTGSIVNGKAVIKNNSFTGSHSTIIQCVKTEPNEFIKANQVYR